MAAAPTHEWVTLPPSPGTPSSEASATVGAHTPDVGAETRADGGAEEPLDQDVPSDNGAKEEVNESGLSNNGIKVTKWDDLSDTTAVSDAVYENISSSPIHEAHDQSHEQSHDVLQGSAARGIETPSPRSPDKESATHSTLDTEESWPKPPSNGTKRKPPPPTKPKPKQRMTHGLASETVPKTATPVTPPSTDEKSTTSSPRFSLSPTASPTKTHTTKITIPVTFTPRQTVEPEEKAFTVESEERASVVESEEKASVLSDSLRSRLLSEESVESSGEEYVPTDDEETDISLKREEHEQTPVSMGTPPPVPKRTKDYHKVILLTETSKSVSQSSSPEKGKRNSPTKAMESPPHEVKMKEGMTDDMSKTNSLPAKTKKRFYERWKLRKGESSKSNESLDRAHSPLPSLPANVPKISPVKKDAVETQKKGKANAKVKKSLSHRQNGRGKSALRRAPSDPTRSTPPPPLGSPGPPRQTFLNMRTRPLPQVPFALSPDEYVDHDAMDYEKVYHPFTPPTSYLPPRSAWHESPPALPDASPSQRQVHPPLQRSTLSSDNVNRDYMNYDQSPRQPTSAVPFSSAYLPPPASSATNRFLPPPGHTQLSAAHPPPRAAAPFVTLPRSLEPAHPLSIPHPLPPSASPTTHSSARKISSGNNSQSLDYDYPFTQVLMSGGRLPPRPLLSGHPFAASIPSLRAPTTMTKSHSADFENEEYVEMTGVSHRQRKDDDEEYQNWEVVKAIRTKRSQSMEDLHYYKNYPLRGRDDQLTFLDLPTTSLPLPPRRTQPDIPQCVIPPRNIPRQVPQGVSLHPVGQPLPVNPTHRGSLDAVLGTSSHDSSAAHQILAQPTASLPPRTLTQQQQLPTRQVSLGSPPLQMLPQSSPRLVHTPKFPQPPLPSQPPVGTSTWTTDNDPSADFYNVVSKSFFTPPQSGGSTESTHHQYLDIVPD